MKLPTLLDAPLSDEMCQEIDFRAQYALLRCQEHPLAQLAGCTPLLHAVANVQGVQACVRSIEQIRTVYRGVTTNLLLMIQELYCDRLGRSIETVVQIMSAQARHTETEPLNDEAVWSICVYFAEVCRQQTSITAQRVEAVWAIVSLEVHGQIEGASGAIHSTALAMVVDLSLNQILSFRVTNADDQREHANLALYDALASCRRPNAEDRSGLAWALPKAMLIDQSYRSAWLEKACADLGIEVTYALSVDVRQQCTVLGEAYRIWSMAGDRLRRPMPLARFEQVFDRFLFTVQQIEPRRASKLRAESFSHLKGFGQDPAAMLPALRWLLPAVEAEIINGSISHNGLHYTHELLELWPGRSARLRVSAEAEARAWVYFDNDVVCPAFAMELRRTDGSLRPNR